MVLTRRSGDKLKNNPKTNHSIKDEDFPSLRNRTKSSDRNHFSHGLESRSRHGSRDDHSSLNSTRLSQLKTKSRTNEERVKHQMSLRSIGLDDEGSSCEEEDVMDALQITPSRGGYSKTVMPRRSSRNRKKIYDTLNISGIEAAMEHDILDSSYSEKRQVSTRHRHSLNPELRDLLIAQGKDPDDMQGLSQPDIYSSIKARHQHRRPRRYFDDFEMSHAKKEGGRDTEDDAENEEENDDHDAEEESEEQENEDDGEEEDDDHDENADNDDEHEEMDRRYSLRTNRAQPLRLIYELQRQPRPQPRGIFDHLPRSPARRKTRMRGRDHNVSPYQSRRRRTNSQGASSSDSTSSSDDENKFERRKKRSMLKARNRCMPMNLSQNDLAKHGFSKERRHIGSSLADVDPMQVDKSTMFSSVGGHHKHIRALKEMVVFPLLYPEVFERFHITPPRGCLFYGPPGTGKTLMARALANECSIEGKKVAFFMRKGADCLSKWVGESERQLRLLFDQAYQMRPAIIFFDEIDGLAPVRSSRQDQIHSSIVSTLLALMDGLDSRGEIIVIGATNRIDSIDPALRRPGRFDREFLFPLPDQKARLEILKIHTNKWKPPLSEVLLKELSERTVGYCGADIKSACTEAAVAALRRRYPQIYASSDKLKLDISSIDITAGDFLKSMQKIVPTARRSANNPSHALNPAVQPLMINSLLAVVEQLAKVFPIAQKKSKLLRSRDTELVSADGDLTAADDSDSDFDPQPTQSWSPVPTNGLSLPTSLLQQTIPFLSSYRNLTVCRPRLLICGAPGNGQSTHLAPALLHDLEGFSFHLLDIPSMYGLSSHTPEEACAQVFREARRMSPSVIYIPNCVLWWEGVSENVHLTFQYLLQSLPASCPVVVIATAHCLPQQIPSPLFSFFSESDQEKFVIKVPTADERMLFFAPVFLQYAVKPPTTKRAPETLEVLDKAEAPAATKLSEQELKKIEESEEATLRSLRLFLRDVLTRLARDRRFKAFLKPVDTEEVPDYTDVISQPMDLSTMVNKIDQHKYVNVKAFLDDIDLICSNALEYNPDHCAEDKAIRHRACLLKDMSHAIVEEDLDPDFERLCNDVQESRSKRMADPSKFAPSFCKVLPRRPKRLHDSNSSEAKEAHNNDKVSSSESVKKIRRTRPKRRRSAWASGVLSRKRKKKKVVVLDDEDDNGNGDGDDDDDGDCEALDHSLESNEINVEMDNGSEVSEDKKENDSVASGKDEKVTEDEVTLLKQEIDEDPIAKIDEDLIAKTVNGSDKNSVKEADFPVDRDPADADILSKGDVELDDRKVEEEADHKKCDENITLVEDSLIEKRTDEVDDFEVLTPRRMMLRSKTQSFNETEEAKEPPPPPVVADHHRLKLLLTRTVTMTASCCVEDLERLYSTLMRCIYKHRKSCDKTALVQDFEKVLQLTANELSRSDSGFHV